MNQKTNGNNRLQGESDSDYFGRESIFGPIGLPSTLSKEDPLGELGFPLRIENALKEGGITTVGQFCEASDDSLIKFKNIGYTTLKYFRDVRHDLNMIWERLNGGDVRELQYDNSTPNDRLISLLLERCGSDRAREVVERRYGLAGREKETLEEIGESFGLTRERIRQIEAKAMNKMRHPSVKAKHPLIKILEELMFENGGIMSDEEADDKVQSVFGNPAIGGGSSIMDLVSGLGWIQSCRIGKGDFAIYSPKFGSASLCKLIEEIGFVVKNECFGLNVADIMRLSKKLKTVSDPRFDPSSFVLRYCRIDPRIEEVNGAIYNNQPAFRRYVSGYTSSERWVAFIRKVLEKEQAPLHFTEIADKVNDLLGDSEHKLDVRRAMSILIECEEFAHCGVRGTYGLTTWGFRKETTTQLVKECLRKAGFPLHWRQIYNYVSKYKDTKQANILAVLNHNTKFERIDSGMYGLRT